MFLSLTDRFIMSNSSDTKTPEETVNGFSLISAWSDHTGQVQTPILLNDENYERWAKLMLNSLRTKRKCSPVQL